MRIKGRRKRDGMKRGVYILPNLLTSASLFCGFYSVIKSLNGDYIAAAWAILFAGIFDLLDGRIARLARAESQFGIEYDSLVDLSSFGLAPGILIYTWTLHSLGKLGWLAAFLFFACGALRLARYNVQHDDVEQEYFQGLPIPVAAYVIATYVVFHHFYFVFPPQNSLALAGMTVALALLMVSTIRYRSMKVVDIKSRNPFFVLVLVVIGIFIVAIKPEVMMFALTTAYLASGLLEEAVTLRQSKRLLERLRSGTDADGDRRLEVVGGKDLECDERAHGQGG
ncbi:MAG: CDP-diacylglycerol--serine O-phosphatidyltransferase [bacterium]